MAHETGTTKQKPQVKYVHKCSQKVIIDRTNLILFGNGKPEDGLAFRFREFMSDHNKVVSDISEIKKKLSTVSEINTEMEIQRRVDIEKEKMLKNAEKSEDKKDSRSNTKKTIRWQSIGVVTAILALVVTATFSICNYVLNRKTKTDTSTIKTDVQYMIPEKTRGNYYDPFAKKDTAKTTKDTLKK
jgi:hypothetical protein